MASLADILKAKKAEAKDQAAQEIRIEEESLSSFYTKKPHLLHKTSLSSRGFPLRQLLHMYCIADKALYTNYLQGFYDLIQWLEPIDTSEFDHYYQAPFPETLYNYTVQEIARALRTDPRIISYALASVYLDIASKRENFLIDKLPDFR